MTKIDVKLLTAWLGAEGAMAGLERSHLTNAELMIVARENGLSVHKNTSRKQIVIQLVMSDVKRVDKSNEYLLGMSIDELQRYFSERLVSDFEIMSILSEAGIAPTGKVQGKLVDFAAREISELGRFQRVAKGSKDKDKKTDKEKD